MPIEAGCRMGICGADPVAIKDGHGVHLRRLRRRAGDARAPRLRRRTRAWRAACGSPARSRSRSRRTRPRRRAVSRIPDFNYDTRDQARRRDRQRHRRRDRRRPPAPAPPGRRDRPDRRGAAPPLQPHGHLAARLRPLARCRASTSTRTPGTRSAGSPTWLNTRALRIDRDAARGRARHRGEAALRPADPRHRLEQLRAADRGLRRSPGTGVLRSADDAIRLRAFAQRTATAPRRRRRRRPARPRGRLRAAQARPEDRRARTLRPAAAPPARRARGRDPAQLPRRARARVRDGGRGRVGRRQRPPARP